MSGPIPTPRAGDAPEVAARRAVMALCGQASAGELRDALARLACPDEAEDLRPPETGLVMTRGRIGGDGRPFNLGEATVTRAAVRLPGGETGFAYHLGRDRAKARLAATLDALWQRRAERAAVEAALAPVAARREAERAARDRRTAATRVNFFTLARGED
ncbi:Alpha-D-ribose 1-methylphosphonate 5-triphosphate synthase subunit PhnG [Methylobacterium crusticola]|uniref:Alpha-D-ribose 1-methylphosphonate 5-triphosphate synthase subunit PhnG n=1 Tax=Methylobacterium crusticola TaxID=1697972 RepID=A0ABQ4QWN5_9HYPH|nr:phosphonate C-P lyase system protein PhnG [Methylobacterium crusticola]GJD49783.1 Alpha-D-ribose 1-methylphosphonate 5-triphosphate synthase subunit PhnG [Methylobacterium crusticola]